MLRAPKSVFVLASLTLLALPGCSSDSSTGNTSTVVLLQQTISLQQGANCDNSGVDVEFNGQAGNAITATASGPSSMHPQFVMYAPDFSTQLAGSSANGAGKAKLTFTLTEPGTHYLVVCEPNGVGGSVQMKVTRPALGS